MINLLHKLKIALIISLIPFCLPIGYAAEHNVKSGDFDHFTIAVPEEVIAGESFIVKVQAYDVKNNLIITFPGPAKELNVTITKDAKVEPIHIITTGGAFYIKISADKPGKTVVSISETGSRLPLVSKEIIIQPQEPATVVAEKIPAVPALTAPAEKLVEAAKTVELPKTEEKQIEIKEEKKELKQEEQAVVVEPQLAPVEKEVQTAELKVTAPIVGEQQQVAVPVEKQIEPAVIGYASEQHSEQHIDESGSFDHFTISVPEEVVTGESFIVRVQAYDSKGTLMPAFSEPTKEFKISATNKAKIQPLFLSSNSFVGGIAYIKVTPYMAGKIVLSIAEIGKTVVVLVSKEITILQQEVVAATAEQIPAAPPVNVIKTPTDEVKPIEIKADKKDAPVQTEPMQEGQAVVVEPQLAPVEKEVQTAELKVTAPIVGEEQQQAAVTAEKPIEPINVNEEKNEEKTEMPEFKKEEQIVTAPVEPVVIPKAEKAPGQQEAKKAEEAVVVTAPLPAAVEEVKEVKLKAATPIIDEQQQLTAPTDKQVEPVKIVEAPKVEAPPVEETIQPEAQALKKEEPLTIASVAPEVIVQPEKAPEPPSEKMSVSEQPVEPVKTLETTTVAEKPTELTEDKHIEPGQQEAKKAEEAVVVTAPLPAAVEEVKEVKLKAATPIIDEQQQLTAPTDKQVEPVRLVEAQKIEAPPVEIKAETVQPEAQALKKEEPLTIASVAPEVIVQPEKAPEPVSEKMSVTEQTTAVVPEIAPAKETAGQGVTEDFLSIPVPSEKGAIAKTYEVPKQPEIEPQPSFAQKDISTQEAEKIIEKTKPEEKEFEIKKEKKVEPAKQQVTGEQIKTSVAAAQAEKETAEPRKIKTGRTREIVIPPNSTEPIILVILPPNDTKAGKSFDLRITTKGSKEDSATDNRLSSDKSSPVRITINSEQETEKNITNKKTAESKTAKGATPVVRTDINSKSKEKKIAAKVSPDKKKKTEGTTQAAVATPLNKTETKVSKNKKEENIFAISDISSIDSYDKALLVIRGSSPINTNTFKVTSAITFRQGKKTLKLRLKPAARKTADIVKLYSGLIGDVHLEEDIKEDEVINLYIELKTGQSFFDITTQKDALIVMISSKRL